MNGRHYCLVGRLNKAAMHSGSPLAVANPLLTSSAPLTGSVPSALKVPTSTYKGVPDTCLILHRERHEGSAVKAQCSNV